MRYFALLPLMLLSLMVYPQNAQEFPSRSGQRTPAARPQTPDLPEELKVAKRKDTEDSAKRRDHVDTRDDRRNPNPRGRDLDDNRFPTRRGDAGRLEREAQDAAEKMANGYGRNLAYREYFQVGFYRGMRNALKDDRLGQWDYQDGIQQGRRDPNARREGRSQGLDLANRIAQEQAVHEVSDQFADLNWRPRPQPNPGRPNFPGAAFASPVDPNLRDLFEAYPLSRWSGFPRDPYLDRWVPEPYRLYECDRYTDFYSNQWREAKRALAAFAQDRRDGAFYRSLNNADKAFFEEEFTDAYLDIMDRIFDTYGDRGYRSGFDCGWDYGAFIQYEISYRKGYNRGVGEAMRQTAESSFFDTYPRAYSAAYNEAFDRWMDQPVFHIAELILDDRDRDGVLEPGEPTRVFARIQNLGGRSGRENLEVSGTGQRLRGQVNLDGRSEREIDLGPFNLPRNVPLPFQLELHAAIADQDSSHFFTLEYPVQFKTGFRIVQRDNLSGRALLQLELFNKSTRDKSVMVRGTGMERGKPVQLRAQGREILEVPLAQLDPLDMLSGRVTASYEIQREGERYDRLEITLPEEVTDLRNDDLLRYTLQLARGMAANRDRTSFMNAWKKRLERDWQVVADGSGNPYKDDERNGGQSTAMGQLVQTYLRERNRLERPEWFTQLGRELIPYAEDLPGTHPFLRKYFVRLAEKLR